MKSGNRVFIRVVPWCGLSNSHGNQKRTGWKIPSLYPGHCHGLVCFGLSGQESAVADFLRENLLETRSTMAHPKSVELKAVSDSGIGLTQESLDMPVSVTLTCVRSLLRL
jgi:hypothetical protein